jgi:hypothetical protein
MSENQTLKEILTPTWRKLFLALVIALFAHLFLVVADIRAAGHSLELVREFWVTNFINALPYLETDNIVLKFLTFFVASYLIVWLFSKVFTFFDNLQQVVTKRIREKA